ncbi:GTP-binding protein HSR1, partial [Cellulomonas sp. zg-B12]|nr:GTP-binding protein HSR1 [Cellulomonas xiejunii]
AAVGALAGRLGARARARAARRRLRASVAEVAQRLVLTPLAAQTDALAACRRQAARAAGR